MKSIPTHEITKKLEELETSDYWFLGEKSWTTEMAIKILEFEKEKRSGSDLPLPPQDAGFCLITKPKWSQIDFGSYNRFYVFNNKSQLKFMLNEDCTDSYRFSEYQECQCGTFIIVQPCPIHDGLSEYRFATLLGTISTAKLSVKICQECNNWRFNHE